MFQSLGETFGRELVGERQGERCRGGGESEKDRDCVRGDLSTFVFMGFFFTV